AVNDAAVDLGAVDAGAVDAATEHPVSSPASFALRNATDRSIYIQASGFSSQAYWAVTEGGAALPVNNTCEVCDCGGCPSCAVCGRGLAKVLEIKPGARHEWSWDGRTWEVVQAGCSANLSCEQEHMV